MNGRFSREKRLKPPISQKLILNYGTEMLTRQQLDLVDVPLVTETYRPVCHSDLAEKILAISKGMIKGSVFVGERYIVARQGQQLFGLIGFKVDHPEIGISIAFRNSYDRSLSIALSVGALLLSCDNLALPAEMTVMRKHTKEILGTLEDALITALYKGQRNYEKVIADGKRLKQVSLSDQKAYQLMGQLFGNNIVSPRQLSTIRAEWSKPSRPEFSDKNMWSLLNITLESLKTSPPITALEQHIQGYNFLTTGKLPL